MNIRTVVITAMLAASVTHAAQNSSSFEVASIRRSKAAQSGDGACRGTDSRLDPRRTSPPLGHCVSAGYLFYLVRLAYERELPFRFRRIK